MKIAGLLALDLPLFAGIDAADLDGIDVTFQEKTLGAWEVLFNQQDTSRDVYFLISGALLAVYWTPEGREIIFRALSLVPILGSCRRLMAGTDRWRWSRAGRRG